MRTRLIAATSAALFLLSSPAAFAADGMGINPNEGMVSLDAMINYEMKADSINMSITCEMQTPVARDEFRKLSQQKFEELKTLVGRDGQVRKSGTPMMYGSYVDPSLSSPRMENGRAIQPPPMDQQYTGSVAFYIRNMSSQSLMKIADGVQDMGCMGTWDARVFKTTMLTPEQRTDLLNQINEKKTFIESLFNGTAKLTRITSLSYYTSPDYGMYGGMNFDPETGMVSMTTTLNVSYAFDGTTASLR